jgi:DNA polymerase-3 subunit delta'
MRTSELHPGTWAILQAQRERPAHALLLGGRGGLLKTELAIEFAASLLCEAPETSGACGRCAACNWFSQGNHPDFRLLRPDAAAPTDEGETKQAEKGKPSREIRIEQVRAIVDFLNTSTHRSGYRVVVVAPAEAMNRNTANALLKSLEEPRPGTVFLLVSSAPDQLLPTIRSRCRQVQISLPLREKSLEYVSARGIPRTEYWLSRAGGAPGLALALANGSEGRLLGILEQHFLDEKHIDARAAAVEVEKLLRSEVDLEMITVVSWLHRLMIDKALAENRLPARHFPEMNGATKSAKTVLETKNHLKINNKIIEFKKLSKHTLNNRLFLEEMFSVYSRFGVTEGQ